MCTVPGPAGVHRLATGVGLLMKDHHQQSGTQLLDEPSNGLLGCVITSVHDEDVSSDPGHDGWRMCLRAIKRLLDEQGIQPINLSTSVGLVAFDLACERASGPRPPMIRAPAYPPQPSRIVGDVNDHRSIVGLNSSQT